LSAFGRRPTQNGSGRLLSKGFTMMFASKLSNRISSHTTRKANRSRPLIEACEPRRMMSSSLTNFAGEYVAFAGGQVLAINIRPAPGADNYSGDIDTAGVDLRFTGKESSSNVLSGNVLVSSKKVAFSATLNGTTLTVTYPSTSTMSVATQVSTTPAPLPPALVSHTRTQFQYKAPAGWAATQGSDGIVISSPTGTEQVSVIATEANGIYTATQIADSEVSSGGTILTSSLLANGPVSSSEYKQAGIGLLEYTRNGKPYVAGQIIETLNFAGSGSGGTTVALVFEVTAPKTQFAAACPTLINMLASIQLNSSAKVAKTTVQSKSHVPGTSGNWSSNAAFAAEEDQYAATIEAETLYSQESINSSVNSFCNFLTS